MSLFSKTEHTFAQTVSDLSFANPFLHERVEFEKAALGKDFDSETRPFWSWSLSDEADRPNVITLTRRVAELAKDLRQRIADAIEVTDAEFELYDDIAHYVIYYSTIADQAGTTSTPPAQTANWDKFSEAFDYWMCIEGSSDAKNETGTRQSPSCENKVHVYCYLSQLQRAFYNIFHCVIGRSWPIAQLRARIWQSIFTHNLKRYRKSLYNKMNEVTTLVTGPSGTGKELVARAVGLSQYQPFDLKTKSFSCSATESFFALNLSALSPTLIESELFGHEKGSFTGATSRRVGFLEAAGKFGTVFLDEIGELDLGVQVKLLRVLQNREFQRVGDNNMMSFEGKVVAATNRDLMTEIESGTFREDFYYRLCSDVIETPSLLAQLEDRPDEIEFIVDFLASRIAPGDRTELTQDVLDWFADNQTGERQMAGYRWPGNIRELEQCVRNIMIHNDYVPQLKRSSTDRAESLAEEIRSLSLTAEDLLGRYCDLAYRKTNSYEKAAAILQIDRRTVKAKIQATSNG
jgi:transcriptional regulator with AAA-type ATPase domain